MSEPETKILSVEDIQKRLNSFINHNDVGTIFPENFFTSIKHWFDVSGPDVWTLAKQRDVLVETLSELADLMDDVREGNYKPDSFTTQPARQILMEVKT